MRNPNSSKTWLGALALALGAVTLAAGCSGNPSAGSPAYKKGTLSNGSFLFKCDDSVACDKWSTGDAKDFPPMIATGANFNLRFVRSGDEGSFSTNSGSTSVTLSPLGPYMGNGPSGLASLKPGYATVIARDPRGYVVDYVTLHIVQPTSLVVYKADYKGDMPIPVDKIALTAGSEERQSFRAVGRVGSDAVAGSIAIQWGSMSPALRMSKATRAAS